MDAAPDVRVAVLMGAGGCFCAGLDVKAGSTLGRARRTMSPPARRWPASASTSEQLQECFTRLESLRVPVIAAIQRACMGAGLELALCCDVRLAAEGTLFSIPEVQLGIVPDMGGTQRLPRTVGIGKAKELIYSARRFDAAEALRIGLVNGGVPGGRAPGARGRAGRRDRGQRAARGAGGQAVHQRHLLRASVSAWLDWEADAGRRARCSPRTARRACGPRPSASAPTSRADRPRRHSWQISTTWVTSRRSATCPTRMHAFAVRQNRFGQPRDAWKREVLPTPTIGPDEVLIYVMASGINYNNVWAALGQPARRHRRAPEAGRARGLPRRRQRLLRHRVGHRQGREERQGRRRGHRAQRLVAARRSVGALRQGPDAGREHPHLGLPDQLRQLLPVRPRPGAPVHPQAEAPHLGSGGLLPALRLHRLPHADGLGAAHRRAGRRGAGLGRHRRPRQHGARDRRAPRAAAPSRSSPTTPSRSSAWTTARSASSTARSSTTGA